MSNWNFGRLLRIGVGYVVGVYSGNWSLFASALMREYGSVQRNKQQRRAIQSYNDGLKDRLEMVDLQPDAPRTLVLGRVRYVEGVRRRWTSGANEEKLTMIVSFAGHQIDGFEQFYFNDTAVTLDGNGWVQTEPINKGTPTNLDVSGVTDGSGQAVVTLPGTPLAGTLIAVYRTGEGENTQEGALTLVSLVGLVATFEGGPAGAFYSVTAQVNVLSSTARIRAFTGAPGQNVGAALAAEYPGKITATDRFEGMAVAVVDILFDPDVYPQGRPSVTAVMRGARCYDPRKDSTVPGGSGAHRAGLENTWEFTQTPPLLGLRYATWSHGWALRPQDYVLADVMAAADVCDQSTSFALGLAPTGPTTPAVLPRYRCAITITADADHAQAMDAIMETMAGRHGWSGGVWRLRAGVLNTPVATIRQDWLVNNDSGGRPDDSPVITAVQTVPRQDRINRVTGSCVDPAQRYQLLPFPAVEDAVLSGTQGQRALEIELQGVTHIAHAQHLASVAIRQAQAGLRLELVCGEQASALELFDVVQLDMPRYGFTNKMFEVTAWTWNQAGAYSLQLAELTQAIFDPLDRLTGRDPAPDSDMRPPWDVEQVTGLTVTSGTVATRDGSIITRAVLSWAPVVGESVRNGGTVEVQYTLASDALPAGDWPSWPEQGSATGTVIPGLLAGRYYLFRARAVQGQPLVRGPWSLSVAHQLAAVPIVDGRYTDLVFRRSATQPATPTGTGTPAGWFDSPPAANGNPLWVSLVDKRSDGSLIGTWAVPVQIDGESLQVEYNDDGGPTGWSPTFVPGNKWARYRIGSTGAWSLPMKIVGEDGGYTDYIFRRSNGVPATPTGDDPTAGPGALWFDEPPAPNGQALYSSLGRKAANGVVQGSWSVPVQIDGDDLQVEYSANGTSGWHPTFVSGTDKWARYRIGATGDWSDSVKIVGENGAQGPQGPAGTTGEPGPAGPRGTVTRYLAGYSAWNSAAASASVPNGIPIVGDTVVQYDNVSFAQERTWDGTWNLPGTVVNGNVLVNGSVTASKLNVVNLAAVSAIMGDLQSGSVTGALIRTASSGARIELNSSTNTLFGIAPNGYKAFELLANEGRVKFFSSDANETIQAHNFNGPAAKFNTSFGNVAVEVNSANAARGITVLSPASGARAVYGDAPAGFGGSFNTLEIRQALNTTSGGGPITYQFNAPNGSAGPRSAGWLRVATLSGDVWVPCVPV